MNFQIATKIYNVILLAFIPFCVYLIFFFFLFAFCFFIDNGAKNDYYYEAFYLKSFFFKFLSIWSLRFLEVFKFETELSALLQLLANFFLQK